MNGSKSGENTIQLPSGCEISEFTKSTIEDRLSSTDESAFQVAMNLGVPYDAVLDIQNLVETKPSKFDGIKEKKTDYNLPTNIPANVRNEIRKEMETGKFEVLKALPRGEASEFFSERVKTTHPDYKKKANITFKIENNLWKLFPNIVDVVGKDCESPAKVEKLPEKGLRFQQVEYEGKIYEANEKGEFKEVK